ncbi:transketolase [Micrococcus sp.]|uniref:transketolase n=1 Tax=Micrococcus sp. TaxID=1271 RepID=UPI002A91BA7F|nr:transketolase [Micrococcus sp.]MDY6054472.1 transketolase [Micrococcus sp.]
MTDARQDTSLDRTAPAREFVYDDADQRMVDTLKVLAADAVEKAGHGHPGTAISLAPVAWQLYQNVMHLDPADARWAGRDRFILSAGHASVLQYLQLFAAGMGLELEDIKALRTEGSRTPGHPEHFMTDGVEMTTGPLGQGLSSAVGFAYDQRRVRGLLDPDAAPGTSPFDHHVFVIASDGDLQEGVSSEASSLAGHQELGNLVVIYDANRISIEEDTDVAFTEDVAARYEAYGWHVQEVDWTHGAEGHEVTEYTEDVRALYDAVAAAKAETGRPSLIRLRTVIGWPSPTKQNTGGIHGSKLGTDEVAALKEHLGFDPQESFAVDPDLLAHARSVGERSARYRADWEQAYQAWRQAHPERARLYDRLLARELPEGFAEAFPTWEPDEKGVATRAASGTVLNALAPVMPELWGGSADLAGSNNTTMKGEPSFLPAHRSTATWQGDEHGRVLHFGIREFAAGAIVNGIALSELTRPYAGTFLQFSDYQRAAVRLAALMGTPSVYVWTHDSVGLGEDGPTHQPVEHLAALRAIPGLDVVRPADANEVAWAWRTVLERHERPAGLVLSRQNVPVLPREEAGFASAEGVARGAYVLVDAADASGAAAPARVVLIATGSEVSVAVAARELLQAEGVPTRVVSAPCLEWFEDQDEQYRESVLPSGADAPVRVSVEAGIAMPWYRWTATAGSLGARVSLEHFGESADGPALLRKYGFTAQNVAETARGLL